MKKFEAACAASGRKAVTVIQEKEEAVQQALTIESAVSEAARLHGRELAGLRDEGAQIQADQEREEENAMAREASAQAEVEALKAQMTSVEVACQEQADAIETSVAQAELDRAALRHRAEQAEAQLANAQRQQQTMMKEFKAECAASGLEAATAIQEKEEAVQQALTIESATSEAAKVHKQELAGLLDDRAQIQADHKRERENAMAWEAKAQAEVEALKAQLTSVEVACREQTDAIQTALTQAELDRAAVRHHALQ